MRLRPISSANRKSASWANRACRPADHVRIFLVAWSSWCALIGQWQACFYFHEHALVQLHSKILGMLNTKVVRRICIHWTYTNLAYDPLKQFLAYPSFLAYASMPSASLS